MKSATFILFILLSLRVLFAASSTSVLPEHITPGLRPDGSLDMPTLQANYKGGELEQVKAVLESYIKDRGSKITRDERIFAHKYLGVIHAADPAGRMRAESYFHQLLDLSPHIELADMFVSKSIQGIFDEVKQDYKRDQEYGRHFDALGHPIQPKRSDSTNAEKLPKSQPSPAGGSSAEGSSFNRKALWITGGFVAMAAAGVVLFYSLDAEEKPGRKWIGDFNEP